MVQNDNPESHQDFYLPADLAVKWAFHDPQFATCLSGVNSLAMVESNLKMATLPLTQSELKMLEVLEKQFFGPLPLTHWENKDVAKYWDDMEAMGLQQNLD